MCALCDVFGTEPIKDEVNLKKVLVVAANYMKKYPEIDHVMEFVNAVTGEGKDFEEDPEFVGNWERAIRDGRLTDDD